MAGGDRSDAEVGDPLDRAQLEPGQAQAVRARPARGGVVGLDPTDEPEAAAEQQRQVSGGGVLAVEAQDQPPPALRRPEHPLEGGHQVGEAPGRGGVAGGQADRQHFVIAPAGIAGEGDRGLLAAFPLLLPMPPRRPLIGAAVGAERGLVDIDHDALPLAPPPPRGRVLGGFLAGGQAAVKS
jgi:hypothetical protein